MRVLVQARLAVLFLVPAVASAQEPRKLTTPDSVPFELAAALATGFPDEPQILVGAIPEWARERMVFPSGARLLGSAFMSSTVVAILKLSSEADTNLTDLRRTLQERGWAAPPPPPSFGGFRSAPTENSASRLTLCGKSDFLTAYVRKRPGLGTHLIMRLAPSAGMGTCRPPQLPTAMQQVAPTLINPAGVPDARFTGDCGAMAAGSFGIGTALRTSMSPRDLLNFYGRQLTDSGWIAPHDSATIVGRTWSRRDSTGVEHEVTVTVTPSTRDAGCRQVNMQTRTVRAP